MNLIVFVALQILDAIQATTLFDVKASILQFAHFLGYGQNFSQTVQHDRDSLAIFLDL